MCKSKFLLITTGEVTLPAFPFPQPHHIIHQLQVMLTDRVSEWDSQPVAEPSIHPAQRQKRRLIDWWWDEIRPATAHYIVTRLWWWRWKCCSCSPYGKLVWCGTGMAWTWISWNICCQFCRNALSTRASIKWHFVLLLLWLWHMGTSPSSQSTRN